MRHILRLIFAVIAVVHGNHYRGSMISWRVVNTTATSVVVELLQRHTWHYYTALCNDSDITAGNKNIGSGKLVCVQSCPVNVSILASVAVPCTAYNIPENFTSGEGRSQVILPANKSLTAAFEGAAWFQLVQGGGNWSVAVQIRTFKRTNGKYNQAPIVTMLPIIRLRRNLTYNVRINVADNDFDPYRCIWSNTTTECSGVCMKIPTNTVLNSTSCTLRFTGPVVGYYAIALTVVDYETTTSTIQLSRVPIQFLFKIWDSSNPCSLSPVYLGEVAADQCIYIEPGQVRSMRILIQIKCPNATLSNIIASYPPGFSRSPIYLDAYDPSINIFMINYTARSEQIGQNLYCFAGVDSIGNQADTTCLRFTVQEGVSSMNTLYLQNATRFPTGTVAKTQSVWTLIYPNNTSYTRPRVNAYVRFKYISTQLDFLTINVATTNDVDYQQYQLVIRTNVIFTPGQSFFISFDPGVFLETSTCLRDSMGITDSTFWIFDVLPEPNTTTTTPPTTTTTESTTLRIRTSPAIRTISSTVTQTTTSITTTSSPVSISKYLTSTEYTPPAENSFPIGGIVGIIIGSLLILVCVIKGRDIFRFIRKLCEKKVKHDYEDDSNDGVEQYQLTTRRIVRRSAAYSPISDDTTILGTTNSSTNGLDTNSILTTKQLVEIQC